MNAPSAEPAAIGRQQAAAILRAVADLIETRPDLPEPTAPISFYVSAHACGDVPAALTAITAALPGPWHAAIHRSGDRAWLELRSGAAGSSPVAGTTVQVSTPATDACEPSGTRTVTTWQPLPAVAKLIGGPGALEDL